jgi:hypothetical protein
MSRRASRAAGRVPASRGSQGPPARHVRWTDAWADTKPDQTMAASVWVNERLRRLRPAALHVCIVAAGAVGSRLPLRAAVDRKQKSGWPEPSRPAGSVFVKAAVSLRRRHSADRAQRGQRRRHSQTVPNAWRCGTLHTPASRPASVYGNKCSGGRWLFFAIAWRETRRRRRRAGLCWARCADGRPARRRSSDRRWHARRRSRTPRWRGRR